MKRVKNIGFLASIMLIVAFLVAACGSQQKKTASHLDNFELIWADEFEYNGLPDSTKWNYDTVGNAWGWGNHELQYYTVARSQNTWVSDGTLKITANKEDLNGFNYTSGRITTRQKGDWQYGRFEINAKLPEGRGLWPAIWMLPTDWKYGGWPKSGEIDIMENVGFDPHTIVASVHTGNYNHAIKTERNNKMTLKTNRSQFHTYALEWTEKQIDAFVDDSLYFTYQKESDDPMVWPFNQNFHLLLNVAVGGDWGGKQGVNDSIFPVAMEVDYVRVYKKR